VAPGQAFPLITIQVEAGAGLGFKYVDNTATVTLTGDPNESNNTDTVTTPRGSNDQIDDNDIKNKCLGGSISVTPRFAFVGEKIKVTVRVESKSGGAAVKVPVKLKGNGKGGAKAKTVSSRTNGKGRTTFTVKSKSSRAAWTASVRSCHLKKRLTVRKQSTCNAIRVNPRSIVVGESRRVGVRLRSPSGRPLSDIWVKVKGQATGDAARTNGRGKANLRVKPRSSGTLTVRASRATTCRVQIGAIGSAKDGSQLTG